MVRDRLPKATIVTFWHIPWPNSETFSICPWREEIIDGLLGSTILGFHTQFHCNNFLEAADRFMESRIDRERASVTASGMETLIRALSDLDRMAACGARRAGSGRAMPRRRCASGSRLPPDAVLLVGIERFDYTKGILDRMRAVDDLLDPRAELEGQAGASFRRRRRRATGSTDTASCRQRACGSPTRSMRAMATGTYRPIELVVRHHAPDEVYELFRAADVCIVSSLHDGMNLVAKEFVAARDDEQGVLILSSFAGASRELSEALIVNPYDTHGHGRRARARAAACRSRSSATACG